MNNEEIEYSEEDFAPIEQCNDPYGKSKIAQQSVITRYLKRCEKGEIEH